MWTYQNQIENSTNLYSIDKTNEEYNASLILTGLLTISPAQYFTHMNEHMDLNETYIMTDARLETFRNGLDLIGSGTHSDVYEATWNVGSKNEPSMVDVAMKVMTKGAEQEIKNGKLTTSVSSFYKEVGYHRMFGGEGFQELIAAFATNKFLVLVTPLKKDVYERNKRLAMDGRKELSPEEVRQFMISAISHLQALHQKEFVHGDVKLKNILVNEKGDYFFGDFGEVYPAEDDGKDDIGKKLDREGLADAIITFAATIEIVGDLLDQMFGKFVLAPGIGPATKENQIKYLNSLGYKQEFMDVIDALREGMDEKDVLQLPFLTKPQPTEPLTPPTQRPICDNVLNEELNDLNKKNESAEQDQQEQETDNVLAEKTFNGDDLEQLFLDTGKDSDLTDDSDQQQEHEEEELSTTSTTVLKENERIAVAADHKKKPSRKNHLKSFFTKSFFTQTIPNKTKKMQKMLPEIKVLYNKLKGHGGS